MGGKTKVKDVIKNNINIDKRDALTVFKKIRINPNKSYLMDVKKKIFEFYKIPNPVLMIKCPRKTLAQQRPANAYGIPITFNELKIFMRLLNFNAGDYMQENLGKRITRDILLSKPDNKRTKLKIKVNTKDDIGEEFERLYREGGEKILIQTSRERNKKLRKDAINKYGKICMVCGFDFNLFYGKSFANDYIEIHHLKLLSQIRNAEYKTNIKDVIVICSNCHRIIHKRKESLIKPKVLQEYIKRNKQVYPLWENIWTSRIR